MSQQNSYTTADYLPWDTAMSLIRKLYDDGKYRTSLLVGCGCFFGLRISDLLQLTWSQLLGKPEVVIWEQKTGKRRPIKINAKFREHIRCCHDAMGIRDEERSCFLNRYGGMLSVQMVNRQLKALKAEYNLPVSNFSTHSLRKTWARAIFENENAQGRGEMALLKLSELMNHADPSVTRRYIGLRQQELEEVYEKLKF